MSFKQVIVPNAIKRLRNSSLISFLKFHHTGGTTNHSKLLVASLFSIFVIDNRCESQSQFEQKSPLVRYASRRSLDEELKMKRDLETHLKEYKKCSEENVSLENRFRKFARKDQNEEPYMTFSDFIHSIILPRFHNKEPMKTEHSCEFVGNEIGHIYYSEYLLLVNLLQIPLTDFDIAFYMFDVDQNGTVDKNEFIQVLTNMFQASNTTDLRRENNLSDAIHSCRLVKYLFDSKKKSTICSTDFKNMINKLKKIILRAEFEMYISKTDKKQKESISVFDFATTLVSCVPPDQISVYLDRIEPLRVSKERVNFHDFYAFHTVIQEYFHDIQEALHLLVEITKESITEDDFIKVAHVVSNVELPKLIVQLAFRVFDEDDNGRLDQEELLKVLHLRSRHVKLDQPRLPFIQKFLKCMRT